LLDDIGDRGGIDPPQLQIVCDNLYDSRDEERRITLEAYERLGGAPQILAGYLERVMRRFDADDLRVAKQILTALISEDQQRLVLRMSDLQARIGSTSSAEPSNLIDDLVAARVLRRRRQEAQLPALQSLSGDAVRGPGRVGDRCRCAGCLLAGL
jgi:hypothetical protein